MSGEFGPSQGDTDFKAPKEEPKPEDGGKKTGLDKDNVYEELYAKMDALKSLKDFTNPDPELVSGLFDDMGKLYVEEEGLQEKINDVFAELYKRGDEFRKNRQERYDRGDDKNEPTEEDRYLDVVSDLRKEVSKAGFQVPNRQ